MRRESIGRRRFIRLAAGSSFGLSGWLAQGCAGNRGSARGRACGDCLDRWLRRRRRRVDLRAQGQRRNQPPAGATARHGPGRRRRPGDRPGARRAAVADRLRARLRRNPPHGTLRRPGELPRCHPVRARRPGPGHRRRGRALELRRSRHGPSAMGRTHASRGPAALRHAARDSARSGGGRGRWAGPARGRTDRLPDPERAGAVFRHPARRLRARAPGPLLTPTCASSIPRSSWWPRRRWALSTARPACGPCSRRAWRTPAIGLPSTSTTAR